MKKYTFNYDLLSDCFCELEVNNKGEFCSIEDVEKLEEENARLKELNREMVEALVNCKDILNKIGCGTAFHVMDKIVTEALQKAGGVRIHVREDN